MKLTFIILLLGVVNTQAWKIWPADSDLNIYALPVGQGDSTIIQCPIQYGGYVTVVDSGSCKSTNFMTKEDVATFLTGQMIEKIFLSDPDKDRINYIDAIMQGRNPYPTKIYHSCQWNANTYGKYIKTTGLTHNQIGGPSCCGKTGTRACPQYTICQGNVKVNVLASGLGGCIGNNNGDSLVLQVEYSGRTLYLPGDFEGNHSFIQSFINCADSLQSDIYQLAHQGAYNGQANTDTILDRIQPLYAFSSSGLKKNYKHPRCEIFFYLRNHDNRLMNTDPHLYTCHYHNQWLNGEKRKGVYMTTVIDICSPTVINYIIIFTINTSDIQKPRLVKFNHFPLLTTQKYQHEDEFYVYNTEDDKCDDECDECDECDTTDII